MEMINSLKKETAAGPECERGESDQGGGREGFS